MPEMTFLAWLLLVTAAVLGLVGGFTSGRSFPRTSSFAFASEVLALLIAAYLIGQTASNLALFVVLITSSLGLVSSLLIRRKTGWPRSSSEP